MTASDADVEAVARAICCPDGGCYMKRRNEYADMAAMYARPMPCCWRQTEHKARAALAADPGRSRMEEALRECRQWLADQIEIDLDYCCPHNEDGTPDESAMDEASRPMIEETRALLTKVDAALDGGGNG